MQVYYQTPINEQFTDSYSQRGLQPSTGGVTPIRSVTVEYKNADPTKRRGGKQEVRKLGATAQKVTGYGMQAAGAGMQAGGKATKAGGQVATRAGAALSSTGAGAVVGVPLAVAGGAAQVAGTGMDVAGKATRKAGKAVSRTKRKSLRKIVPKVNAGAAGFTVWGIWSWAGWVWMWIQVPFAIISLIMLGLTQAIYTLFTRLQAQEGDGWLEAAAKWVGRALASVMDTAIKVLNYLMEKFLGFNLETLNPASFFLLAHTIVIVVGWATLFIILFLYTLRGYRMFGGENSGTKVTLFLIAFVGYTIPIMNLFPWFLFWTLSMMKTGK